MIKKFAFNSQPGTEESKFFCEHGYLYVENFFDFDLEIRPLLKNIFDLIDLLTAKYRIPIDRCSFGKETFDSGLPYLLRHHRTVVGVLYDAVKKLPNYIRLAASSKNDDYCRALLDSKFVGFAPRGYGIRMDHPGEAAYSTQLHQDYVSQLCSQNGVVLWSPLRDVTPDLGPVRFFPGSHRAGIFPILKMADGSRGLLVDHEEEVRARYSAIQPEVRVGDCVIMHTLLLHESGENMSEKTRWSMISRYFDFTDETGVAINWKGGLQEGNFFEKVHPELTRIASTPETKAALT